MLGFPILYFKGMRLLMFQLSGFHCNQKKELQWRLSGYLDPLKKQRGSGKAVKATKQIEASMLEGSKGLRA